MYVKVEKIHDSEELYQENKNLKKRLSDNDAKLEKISEEIKLKTAQIPDDKMQEMFDKYMKEKFSP